MTGRVGAFTLGFLKTEAGAGVVLTAAAVVAVVLANSAYAADYFAFVGQPFTLQIGGFRHTESVLEWTKEGLMTVFFFIVGLEIKYEVSCGELSDRRKLALPVLSALGGMVVPIGVYLAFNAGAGGQSAGWPVPVATDIAFAVGALAILGRGLPSSLRIFLLTLAIVDDLGAVILIGLLFSSEVQPLYLLLAVAVLAGLVLLSRFGRTGSLVYGIGLLLVWGLTFESGVSPAIAGVATALAVPVSARSDQDESLAHEYMEGLHPYVAYAILPFFAFVAAGFSFAGLTPAALAAPMPLGIALGLVVGKTVGVFGAAWLTVRSGLGVMPSDASWLQLLAVSALCGIGFTMSLFIGGLAFDPSDETLQTQMKLGVIGGSLLSLALGGALLALGARRSRASPAS